MNETLFRGGTVVTVDPLLPRAEAVLVRGSRIVAVGDEGEIVAAASPSARIVDLDGRALLPGFNDAHIHLANLGMRETQVDLAGLTKAEILDRLVDHDRAQPDSSPLLGFAWDYPSCPDPHRSDLDAVFPDRPVILIQFSGHGAWLNTAALGLLKLTRTAPDWGIGGPERDESGELTGILREPGDNPRLKRLWFGRMRDRRAVREGLGVAMQRLAEHGITSVQDNTWWPVTLSEIRTLHRRGGLTCRVQSWSLGKAPLVDLWFSAHRFNDDWYARGPRKYFWDGAFSSHSAWLLEPYADRPDTRGHGMDVDAIERRLRRAVRGKRQVAAHAIGDAAVAAYVEAASRLRARDRVRRLRFRVEHGQIIAPGDIERIRELGMIVSAQPHAAVEPEKDRRLLGAERAGRAYPYRSLLDAGVPLAFGSDYPGEATYDPLFGVHLAVNRDGDEAISVDEAIASYTAGGAYAEWKENEKGRIRPGFLADLVVLSADPAAVDPATIRDIAVDLTVVDGATVFARAPGGGRTSRRAALNPIGGTGAPRGG
jgi:predicted amidohydrolase YtcJ